MWTCSAPRPSTALACARPACVPSAVPTSSPTLSRRSLTRTGCTVERDGEDFMGHAAKASVDLPRQIDLIEDAAYGAWAA